MSALKRYLNRAGTPLGTVTTKRLSYSKLNSVKTLFLGGSIPEIKPEWLEFGSNLHAAILFNETASDSTVRKLKAAFFNNPLCNALMEGSKVEEFFETELFDKKFVVGYDILNTKNSFAADLKSTSAPKSRFLKSALSYGYFNQAYLYLKAKNLKKFYFIGAVKTTCDIFVIDATKFTDHLKIAENEIKWLIYLVDRYGNSG